MSNQIDTKPDLKKSKMDSYIEWFFKWFPESFFITLALTIIVALAAMIFTKTPLLTFDGSASVVSAWNGGFWSLLAFIMQMTILLVTGGVVASSPPIKKLLIRLASLPNNRVTCFIMVAAIAGFCGYIHWGVGMMLGIVFGREIAAAAKKKGIKIHAPVLWTVAFCTMPWGSAGISGAASIYSATPGYLKGLVAEEIKPLVPDALPLTDTVAAPPFILLLIIGAVIYVLVPILMHPKTDDRIREIDDDFLYGVEASAITPVIPRNLPSERMNASRIVMLAVGGVGLFFAIAKIAEAGLAGLSLNLFNFLFLMLGMVLCFNQGPEYYCKLFRDHLMGTWGFILQFSFYAGIFGIIVGTGLGTLITNGFTSISTPSTWPVITYIYSAILNIFVPSGGSKFVIEAPYIIPTSLNLGTSLNATIQAYQMGDSTTNLIIPFFALPYLANFKVKFNDIIPYSLPAVVIVFVVNILYFAIVW
ncbi:TIGR00366 family protein [Papillibacter cinnamivorans]|uniref:Short-chain fatty acids transporter n=1 Tax=Papillibacter cinnamivorans DSM 12816 TaxID=1122930 RepID=A0A1W2C962_9FIRM|nr:TIGR00366 family protein [Papillibacter cinnamivorans]SMC81785.1 short-chain fatty acids transporter [Papillibacter cinnamivorans DSM 12816]